MSATFQFFEHNGAPGQALAIAGTPTTSVNWKSVDDIATSYNVAALVVGTNSFEKWQYGRFTGAYTQLLNGRLAHTAGNLPAGVSLFGPPTMTADVDRRIYRTPARTEGSGSRELASFTAVTAIGQGSSVWFGLGSPGASGKVPAFGPPASTDALAYTNYLVTQIRVGDAALPGVSQPITLTFRFDENAIAALLIPAFSLLGSLMFGSAC